MEHRRVTIASGVGLHARPASILARSAGEQSLAVRIAKVTDGTASEAVDAASILGLMALGAHHGDVVELSAEGPRAAAALDTLAALLEQDLDQPAHA